METLCINGKAYTETPCFINKKVKRKNDNSLFAEIFICIDDIYTNMGVKLAVLVSPENELKVRSFSKDWKKLIQHEYYNKLEEVK